MKVFECNTLIDGYSDEPLHDVTVVVEDGTVCDVVSSDEMGVPSMAERIDLSDGVVIPGLTDAHLHLQGSRSMNPLDWVSDDKALAAARATVDLQHLIQAGFTTVRDCASTTGVGLSHAVAEGEIVGPRVFASGQAISQTAGHGDLHTYPIELMESGEYISRLADGTDECRRVAREHIREGVDLIKIAVSGGVLWESDLPDEPQFTEEEITAITKEAHRVGLPVAAHAQGATGIKNAIQNGVDTIEHGFSLDDEGIELLLENEGTLVPTLGIYDRLLSEEASELVPEQGIEETKRAYNRHLETVSEAAERGVRIALGSDFLGAPLVPHGENALEAELYVNEVGMAPMDAIQAATGNAGHTVPDDAVGGVEPGRYADLVMLSENPLKDITALRDVKRVYKEGTLVSSS